MATTWAEITTKLDSFLDDAVRTQPDGSIKYTFPIALRVYSWNWAQNILARHTPLQKTIDLSVESGGRAATLPSDLFQVYRIYDSAADKFMRYKRWKPGDYRIDDEDLPEYWVWNNQLLLEKDASSTTLTLYYWAYYPPVDVVQDANGNDVGQGSVLIPKWAELPMLHLTTASCMNPGEVEASDLNQYKSRLEAGTPVHNPRAESVLFHLEMWNTMLSWYPPLVGVD